VNLLSFKKKIFFSCIQILDQKVKEYKIALHDLTVGAENDSKSSAGDKHETARAMMQLEHEKISRQLNEVLEQKNTLEKINPGIETSHITQGSLIKTNKGYFFLSISLGKIIVEKTEVMILSAQSPLGLKLLKLKKDETAEINSVQYFIENFC